MLRLLQRSRRGRRAPTSLAIAFVGLALPAAAQDTAAAEPLVVGPVEAVRLAVAEHPLARRERERLEELGSAIVEARSRALPSVAAEGSVVRNRDPGLLNSPNFADLAELEPDNGGDPGFFEGFDISPIPVTTYDYRLLVNQTLYSFGKISTGIEAAEALRRQVAWEIREVEIGVARNALVALYDVALAREQLSVLSAERASRERQVEQAEDFLEIGTGTRLALLQARAALSALVPREIGARGDLERAKVALNEALGRGPTSPVTVVPDLLARAELPTAPDVEALLLTAASRPEFEALEVNREALALQRRAVQTQLRPEVVFNGSYGIRTIFTDELGNTEFASWDAGVFLNWQLFDGFATRSQMRQISSQIEQNALFERARYGEVARDLLAARAAYEEAVEAAAAATEGVAQAEEALRVAEEESRWGAATPLQVLEAQRTVTETQFQRLQAVHDALVALADIHRLAGEMPLGFEAKETP